MEGIDAAQWICSRKLKSLLEEKEEKIILLDLRSFMNYNLKSIQNSINVCVPMALIKRKNFSLAQVETMIACESDRLKFRNRQGMTLVIFDDVCDQVKKNLVLFTLFQKILEENLIDSIYFLRDGFQDFSTKYPESCNFKGDTAQASPVILTPFPSQKGLPNFHFDRENQIVNTEISNQEKYDQEPVEILDFLFVGSQDVASSISTLGRYSLTYILNAAHECPNYLEHLPQFSYKRLDLHDHAGQNLNVELFEEAFQFINEAKIKGQKVLVHCRAGQSRSATIVISYLIRAYGWSLQQAYCFVQAKRPSVSPNLGFMAQIVQFEKIEIGKTTCMHELASSNSSLNLVLNCSPTVSRIPSPSPSTSQTSTSPTSTLFRFSSSRMPSPPCSKVALKSPLHSPLQSPSISLSRCFFSSASMGIISN